jgi:hypothetical protein
VAYVSNNSTDSNASLVPRFVLPPNGDLAGSKRQQVVKGSVARVNRDSGTVSVRLDPASGLEIGDQLKVSHRNLLDAVVVGYLEVTAKESLGVKARPVDGLKLDKVARGDEAILVVRPARTFGRASHSASAADSPALATSKADVGR